MVKGFFVKWHAKTFPALMTSCAPCQFKQHRPMPHICFYGCWCTSWLIGCQTPTLISFVLGRAFGVTNIRRNIRRKRRVLLQLGVQEIWEVPRIDMTMTTSNGKNRRKKITKNGGEVYHWAKLSTMSSRLAPEVPFALWLVAILAAMGARGVQCPS